jgi:hypothetical protein
MSAFIKRTYLYKTMLTALGGMSSKCTCIEAVPADDSNPWSPARQHNALLGKSPLLYPRMAKGEWGR